MTPADCNPRGVFSCPNCGLFFLKVSSRPLAISDKGVFSAPPGRLLRPRSGGCSAVQKKGFLKKLVAVDGGGQLAQLSTGSGLDALQWKGWARPEPEGLSPPLWWGQRLCPCLERATGRGVGIPKKNGPFGPLGWCRGYSLCFRPSLNVTSSVIELMPFRTSASVPPSVISGPSKRTVSGLLVVFLSSRETTT